METPGRQTSKLMQGDGGGRPLPVRYLTFAVLTAREYPSIHQFAAPTASLP